MQGTSILQVYCAGLTMFFETYFLCSYNRKMAECLFDLVKPGHPKYLMLDCPCYKIYQDPESFKNHVIIARNSYMACICYNSKFRKRKRTDHLAVPIVLGSYLDYRIRGLAAIVECRAQWGTVILKGDQSLNNVRLYVIYYIYIIYNNV